MVNELRELLRDNIASEPPEGTDLSVVLSQGRRRMRRRRGFVIAGVAAVAVATAAVVALVPLTGQGSDPGAFADHPPSPDAPTLNLADADMAVEGRDYRVLASHTNDNLDRRNGQYFDGLTDDGLVLFSDGPHGVHNTVRRALMDPASGAKDWLPAPPNPAGEQLWPVDLGVDRLVFTGLSYGNGGDGDGFPRAEVFGLVFDRQARTWKRVEWSALPKLGQPASVVMGPDGRLYVPVLATEGKSPSGGGSDGEADDAGAEGETYNLWSVSLTDHTDVRDEGLRFGAVAFTDEAMVWTDRTNGGAGLVHVRDLESGEEHSFDPNSGERCNLLSFGATADRIVLGQYCGTYAEGRDDRVQILTTDGEQVVTIQDGGINGGLAYGGPSGLVTIDSDQDGQAGTYVYDLDDDRFLRVSDSVSHFTMGGPTQPGTFMWHTSVNDSKGATQWLGQLLTD